MSVRVVARVRPLLKAEVDRDQIVSIHNGVDHKPTVVKIPNPKNSAEEYNFQFNSVYGQESTQQEIFDAEVSPTVKHLFQGYDVTIFAYGSTGTGKTHTMRGGKLLADRGMIPRLLSSIYRKSRAVEKAGNGETRVEVSMSYYEIYNDRVFDLFEPPEKRTVTGLPIREAEGGKTVVVGLTEVPCGSLKEFEVLYDKANANRSTGATKLNAHSSRSHAVLCVKVTLSTPTEIRVCTASAIDLAGSEDNRRTGNGKDRMVESASINKSLFVLAQCVEAISKKQNRIPYRESKMTRILSLGQNNGFTVMILNLAPVKAFHLDTLSSLNFANRTKKIEVREIENEPMFKGPPRTVTNALAGVDNQRQPLRALTNNINVNMAINRDLKTDKPAKLFSVYSDKSRVIPTTMSNSRLAVPRSSPLKRSADSSLATSRPAKHSRYTASNPVVRRGPPPSSSNISTAHIESLVERKVTQILAQKALNAPAPIAKETAVSADVQARLDSIERRLEGQEGERAEGLSYLFMAKQHQARGEEWSALKMYELATPFFPGNEKLQHKIEKLRRKISEKRNQEQSEDYEELAQLQDQRSKHNTDSHAPRGLASKKPMKKRGRHMHETENSGDEEDASYFQPEHSDCDYDDDDGSDDDDYNEEYGGGAGPTKSKHKSRTNKKRNLPTSKAQTHHSTTHQHDSNDPNEPPSPRTLKLLSILNSREPKQIQKLNGLGVKKANMIVACLNSHFGRGDDGGENNVNGYRDYHHHDSSSDEGYMRSKLETWSEVLALDVRGIGVKSWEGMKEGLTV